MASTTQYFPKSYTDTLLKSVTVNQLPASTTSWLSHVLFALNSKDVDACSFMSPSVKITLDDGNGLKPNVNEINTIREGLKNVWQAFKSIRQEELMICGDDRNLVHKTLNHYETLDGRKVNVKAVAVIERDGEGGLRHRGFTMTRVYCGECIYISNFGTSFLRMRSYLQK